jgi:signal transduction histidine kinase
MYDPQSDTRLFAELYDVQPQAIFWQRPFRAEKGGPVTDFEYAYANDEGLHYLNMSRKQFTGLTLSAAPLTAELRKRIFEEMIAVYRTGKKSDTTVYNPILNKYARVLRAKLRDGVLTVVQDVTREHDIIRQLEKGAAQLEAQAALLREQKNLLDNILENSSNGISVSQVFRDWNGKVVDALTILANDAAVKYIGFPKDIYLSKRATEIEPGVIGSPYYQACIDTLETGEPFVMQYRMEATSRWLELTVSKMDNDHLIQVFTDITPVKEVQLQVERYVEELKRSNQNLEEFAYAASHDLKEPIRKIHFFSERLREELKDGLTENQKSLFGKMEHASRRMEILINDLLAYSQVSRDGTAKEEIDLNAKLQTVLDDLELEVAQKKAEIKVDHLPVVKGNRRQLQQLFQNLVSNALKYTRPGYAPRVHISSKKVKAAEVRQHIPAGPGDSLYHFIEVRDNGIGFEQKEAERIFNVFTRLHGNSEYRGSGVGLSIAQKVVANHQGYIWAESEPGKGASFKILLPVD